MREDIIMIVKDLVMDLLYYDRKEDEEVGINEIQMAIKNGVITEEEIVKEFARGLKEGIGS